MPSHKVHGVGCASMSTLSASPRSMELVSLAWHNLKNTWLLLELLDLLRGELCRESVGSMLVVVEHGVLGLLLAAEDGSEGADVELLGVGVLGAVHVDDVHGRLLRRRGWRLLRLGRHGDLDEGACCCCCEEEEDEEGVSIAKLTRGFGLHRRRFRGGFRV